MYAIFENGSHQFQVREGDLITVDRQPGKVTGDEVVFDRVLLVAGTDADPKIGTPTVAGARSAPRSSRSSAAGRSSSRSSSDARDTAAAAAIASITRTSGSPASRPAH